VTGLGRSATEGETQVPFGFAQGRLSTSVASATFAQNDSKDFGNS